MRRTLTGCLFAALAACARPPLAVEVQGDRFEVGEEVEVSLRVEGVPADHYVYLVLERDRPGHAAGDPDSEQYFGFPWQDFDSPGRLSGGDLILPNYLSQLERGSIGILWRAGVILTNGGDVTNESFVAPGRYRLSLRVTDRLVAEGSVRREMILAIPAPVASAESDWFLLDGFREEWHEVVLKERVASYLGGLAHRELVRRLGPGIAPVGPIDPPAGQLWGHEHHPVEGTGDGQICASVVLGDRFRGMIVACSPRDPDDEYGVHFAPGEVEWSGDIDYVPGQVRLAEARALAEASLAGEPGPVHFWGWRHGEAGAWVMLFQTGATAEWDGAGAGRMVPAQVEVVLVARDGAACRVMSHGYADWEAMLFALQEGAHCAPR